MESTPAKFETKFVKKEKISRDAYTFYFKRPQGFKFSAGQYMRVFLKIENPDERGSKRYFTISSSPKDKEFLTITTRIIKSSFKLALNSLKIGDTINAYGPMGYFTFNQKDKKTKIFLAGGIGITPYHSILKTIDGEKGLANIYLFDSFSTKEQAVFFDELKEIEKRNPNVKVIYTLTKEKTEGFEYGRIDEKMIAKYCPDYRKAKFFIIGSEAVEYGFLEMVKDMGIKEENIFSENFPGY